MRVAFVSMHTAQRRPTGATRRTRRTAELLAADGHDVTVFCARWWEGDIREFEQDGVTYHAVTDDPATGRFASKLPFALRKGSPEVIQAAVTPPAGVTAATTAARFLRTPVVVDWWSADGEGNYGRAARAPNAVVAPSRTAATEAREHGADESSVRVVPDFVDMDRIREAPVDERADVVYARDLDEHANVESFLLALAELRRREWRAAVVGDGPAREDVERTARDLRIDDRVEFLGDLPPDETIPVLKGAHVFAQTATRAPFATELLRALACGCVGIVEYQARSSAHELVEGRDRGALVTSPQELADEIVAAAGVEHATVNEAFARFDRGRVLGEYLDCYESAVSAYGLF